MTNYSKWLDKARLFYSDGQPRSTAFRHEQLSRLATALGRHESDLLAALHADLGKPAVEAYASELGFVLSDIRYAQKRLRRWMRPRRRAGPLLAWPSRGAILPEPRGVVLIIGPWNYPVQLLLSPLVAALAAGNCVALKPSEYAPETSKVLARLIGETFDPGHVALFEGDADTARALLELPFDHIFFTGSTAIGRKVMAAASRNLASVTLELGGRNPCIVCEDAKLPVAARRIAWGKFVNAGQTCVAPNHVLVHRSRYEELVGQLRATLRSFYGEDAKQSADYGRIVSERHTQRLINLLEGVETGYGGGHDLAECYLEPTIVLDPPASHPLMQEEIFGPILPVCPYDDLDAALADLAAAPTPLALYVFTGTTSRRDHILARVPSGGAGINDTMHHIVGKALPFGGLGASGMGAYHGEAGFDCFTHYRSVLLRSPRVDPGLAYPPFRMSLQRLKKVYGWMLRL